MYPEDIDLSRRLRQDHIVLYYPAVSIIHAHAAASYRNLRMLRIHADNMRSAISGNGVYGATDNAVSSTAMSTQSRFFNLIGQSTESQLRHPGLFDL